MYQLFLFLHIVGALGLFAAIALEWTSLLRLRRAATVEQAREWNNLAASLGRVYAPSMLAILVSGIYMAATAWAPSGIGAMGWIIVSFIAMITLSVVGVGLSRRPMTTIMQALATARDERGHISAELGRQLRNPLAWVSVQTRAGIALGIVFCMTVKPDAIGALLAIAVAAALGFAASLPALGRGRELRTMKETTTA